MDKTYAESKNAAPFDWNLFLERAEQEEPTEERCREASALAGSWVTCACGNQCAAIPRHTVALIGCPEDIKLSELGIEFMERIDRRDWKIAKNILKRIELRSKELLTEIYKQR